MINLSSEAIQEKNKISASGVWLLLVEAQFDAGTIYLVNNNEDIEWPTGSETTWVAFPMLIGSKISSSDQRIPSLIIQVANASQLMQSYLETESGGANVPVIIRLVHSDHLDLESAEIEESYTIKGSSFDRSWVYFELSLPNPFTKRFPKYRYLKNFCRWKFKSSQCGYSGGESTCNHTLTDCIDRNNDARFGGFPGVSYGGIYV